MWSDISVFSELGFVYCHISFAFPTVSRACLRSRLWWDALLSMAKESPNASAAAVPPRCRDLEAFADVLPMVE